MADKKKPEDAAEETVTEKPAAEETAVPEPDATGAETPTVIIDGVDSRNAG